MRGSSCKKNRNYKEKAAVFEKSVFYLSGTHPRSSTGEISQVVYSVSSRPTTRALTPPRMKLANPVENSTRGIPRPQITAELGTGCTLLRPLYVFHSLCMVSCPGGHTCLSFLFLSGLAFQQLQRLTGPHVTLQKKKKK